jgi:hypothetical protein
MTGTNCDLFTHKQFRSYLNHIVEHSNTPNQCKNWNTVIDRRHIVVFKLERLHGEAV